MLLDEVSIARVRSSNSNASSGALFLWVVRRPRRFGFSKTLTTEDTEFDRGDERAYAQNPSYQNRLRVLLPHALIDTNVLPRGKFPRKIFAHAISHQLVPRRGITKNLQRL